MANKSFEQELRDNMYRVKLSILNERLQKEQSVVEDDFELSQKSMPVPNWSEVRDHERDSKIKQMDIELKKAKKKYEKLKETLKEQKRENKMALSMSREVSMGDRNIPDKFNQYFEMMMQQTQTQSMLMNQLLMRNNSEKQTQPNIIPIPVYPQMYPFNPLSGMQERALFDQPATSTQPTRPPKSKNVTHPFPGNEAQQRLRQIGLATLFCAILDTDYEENSVSLTDKFLFEIKIKEIITAIQKYYLKHDGPINKILQSIISDDAINYRTLVTKTGNTVADLETNLNNLLKSLVSSVTEIMPPNGTLGCETRSILCEFIQTNQSFPDAYFLSRELDLIQLDSTNTVRNVGAIESQLLLIGIFFVRALVMTVMLKSSDYGWTKNTTVVGQDNLRIVSSLIIRIYRMIIADFVAHRYPTEANKKVTTSQPFLEFKDNLLSDEELTTMFKSMKTSIDYGKNIITKWATTYATKLRPS